MRITVRKCSYYYKTGGQNVDSSWALKPDQGALREGIWFHVTLPRPCLAVVVPLPYYRATLEGRGSNGD